MSFTAVESASGTLTANTASGQITFGSGTIPIRYAYVAVNNTGTTVLYARTDGNAATVGGDHTVAVQPGTTQVVANSQPLWTQAANVIPQATSGRGNTNPANPSENQPFGSSYYGQAASPGTSVSLISTGTPSYTVSGTG